MNNPPILMRIKLGWLDAWKASVGEFYVPVVGFEDGKIVEFLEAVTPEYYRVRSVEFPYNIGESLWAACLERIDE